MPEIVIDSDHPAIPGHFPGQPVVPAAVILSRVLAAARATFPDCTVTGIHKARFLHRIVPGEPFRIELGTPARGGLKFVCTTADAAAVDGRLTLADDDTDT